MAQLLLRLYTKPYLTLCLCHQVPCWNYRLYGTYCCLNQRIRRICLSSLWGDDVWKSTNGPVYHMKHIYKVTLLVMSTAGVWQLKSEFNIVDQRKGPGQHHPKDSQEILTDHQNHYYNSINNTEEHIPWPSQWHILCGWSNTTTQFHTLDSSCPAIPPGSLTDWTGSNGGAWHATTREPPLLTGN